MRIGSDFRLSSYGPSFLLAKQLCMLGEWAAVAEYLERCRSFWVADELDVYVEAVARREVPDFSDR